MDIMEYVRERGLGKDPIIRQKMGEVATDVEIAVLMAWRVVSLQARGEIPAIESAMAKYYTTETSKKITNIGMQFMGVEGILKRGSERASLEGRMESYYRSVPFLTIGAGTSEIMKMLIAYRGLGIHK